MTTQETRAVPVEVEAKRHATELEQCAIFAADAGPSIAKAMTDAAEFLRNRVATAPAPEPVGEVVLFGSDLKEISWRKGKLPPVGTKLYAAPPAPLPPHPPP